MERMMVTAPKPEKRSGLPSQQTTSSGGGNTNAAASGRMRVATATATTITAEQTAAMTRPGRAMAAVFASQRVLVLRGVARRVSKCPLAFSLIRMAPANTQRRARNGRRLTK